MTPAGIVAVVVLVGAMSLYRWRVLATRGEFAARSEWTFWLFGVGAIGVAVLLTMAGRLALLVATPCVLIPSGWYLLRRAEAVRAEFGLDLRNAGWAAIATGVIAALVLAMNIASGLT